MKGEGEIPVLHTLQISVSILLELNWGTQNQTVFQAGNCKAVGLNKFCIVAETLLWLFLNSFSKIQTHCLE